MRLAQLDHLAVGERGLDMAGEALGIRIVRIDAVAHLGGERAQSRIGGAFVGEGIEPGIAEDHAGGDAIGDAELAGIAVGDALLVRQRFPQAMDVALGGVAEDVGDRFRLDTLRGQPARAVYVGMGHRPAGIRLEGDGLRDPGLAEAVEQRPPVAVLGMSEALVETVLAFEHRARADEAGLRQHRRVIAALRRPAGMQPLGPGAFGQVLDDTGCHAAGDAQRGGERRRLEADRGADAGGRAEGPEHGGRMEACLVQGLGDHGRKPAGDFEADGDAAERVGAGEAMALGGRQNRGQDHRPGMHGAALEGVVEILAMGGGAVDDGGTRRIEAAGMADGGAGAAGIERGLGRADVVEMARGDAEAGHVGEQQLRDVLEPGRDRRHPLDGSCKSFGDSVIRHS